MISYSDIQGLDDDELTLLIKAKIASGSISQHELLDLSNVFRQKKIRDKSLIIAKIGIYEFRNPNVSFYVLATFDLISLSEYDDALRNAQQGLSLYPGEEKLIKSQDYAKSFMEVKIPRAKNQSLPKFQFSQRDIIAYSHEEMFFHKINQPQSIPTSTSFSKSILFVTGLGRSGTTALGKMLTISPDICLFTELYNWNRPSGYTPHDFEEQVLIDAIDISKHPINKKEISKYHTASYIGDKRPDFIFCAERTFNNFEGTKISILFILRNLIQICASSYKRADDPNDLGWNKENGIIFTILWFNATMRQLLYLKQFRPDIFKHISFVNYSDIFSQKKLALALFDGLGIEINNHLNDQLDQFFQKSKSIVHRNNVECHIDSIIKEHISKYLDFVSYKQCIQSCEFESDLLYLEKLN
ncbi:sulfotransferase [Synechococcus sp. AH-601-B19]|nr:sulfotransferase [Synechococcus sp. AH-601-B19]